MRAKYSHSDIPTPGQAPGGKGTPQSQAGRFHTEAGRQRGTGTPCRVY